MPFQTSSDGLEMHVDIAGTRKEILFRAKGVDLEGSADAGLAAMLLPAMRVGGSLICSEPSSVRLVGSLPRIQEIFRNWEQHYPSYSCYQTVTVETDVRQPERPRPGRGVASFFTGGVDSFYTVARHREEIDALVYVHGFDVPLDKPKLDGEVVTKLRQAASMLDKPLIEVWTNIRSITDRYAEWVQYHGSALAAVALLLAPAFAKIYVPATLTYAHLMPLGSHPLLDPLWSTEEVELIHDGCESSRLEKLPIIVDDPAARATLRVCWENRRGRYNCGSCEKCLRTMVCMRALGLLDAFETFPDQVDLAAIARVAIPESRYVWGASYELLKRSQLDPALERALGHRLYSKNALRMHSALHTATRGAKVLRSIVKD
jgi:hypothetical protein